MNVNSRSTDKTRTVCPITNTLSCTTSYLPWNRSDQDYPPSCTSSGPILQLCKVSSVFINLLRRSCTYKKCGHTHRQSDSYIPPKPCLPGYKHNNSKTWWDHKNKNNTKKLSVSSNSFYATHSIFDDSYPFNNTYHINRSITVIILNRNVNTEDMGELRQVCYGAI